jgi:AraC family transcriptional regulator
MIFAGSIEVTGSTRFRKHEHESAHVCVVLGGGFIERDRRSWRDVGPGTLRVSGAARHDIDFSPAGAACLLLELDPDVLNAALSPRFIEDDSRMICLATGVSKYATREDPLGKLKRDDLVTELVAQIDRRLRGRTSPPPPWLERIPEMVCDTGGTLSVEQLATSAGVHRVHLARVFRDHYGVSVSTYIRKVRVRGALALMARGTMSLSELAFTAGFADQSHLTREIRAATGETPGTLRAMLHPFKT